MPSYTLAGLTVASQQALPELLAAEGSEADWVFQVAHGWPLEQFTTPVHDSIDAQGRVWLAIRRHGHRYLLRFPGLADFVVLPSEGRVACVPDTGVDDSTVRHLLLDQVVPHILALDGSLVLHASAVAVGEGAVAFVGHTGAGKSSLAASFASRGFPLLSDDFLLLREHAHGFLAVPSYPGLRVWPDSADLLAGQGYSLTRVAGSSDKQRLTPRTVAAPPRPRPLLAVVELANRTADGCAAVNIARLARRQGFMAIFQQAFRMERSGRERQLADLDRFALSRRVHSHLWSPIPPRVRATRRSAQPDPPRPPRPRRNKLADYRMTGSSGGLPHCRARPGDGAGDALAPVPPNGLPQILLCRPPWLLALQALDVWPDQAVAGIKDVLGVSEDQIEVEDVVVGEHEDGVGRLELPRGELGADDGGVDLILLHVGIHGAYSGAEGGQLLGHDQGGGLAGVAGIGLVGEPQQEDPRPPYGLRPPGRKVRVRRRTT